MGCEKSLACTAHVSAAVTASASPARRRIGDQGVRYASFEGRRKIITLEGFVNAEPLHSVYLATASAIRLLHQRHDHAIRAPVGTQSEAERRRGQGRIGQQSSPLRLRHAPHRRLEKGSPRRSIDADCYRRAALKSSPLASQRLGLIADFVVGTNTVSPDRVDSSIAIARDRVRGRSRGPAALSFAAFPESRGQANFQELGQELRQSWMKKRTGVLALRDA